jgi:fermentation-respiration switch protein FrsA (DUF1100 family)
VRWRAVAVTVTVVALAAACGGGDEEAKPAPEVAYPAAFAGTVDAFYAPPDPLPEGRHGDLLRYQRIPDDGGRDIFRVMYLSESRAGAPIAVTGLVAVPSGPGADRLVLGWSHGTTGIADSCAPSRQSLGVVAGFVDILLERGWIVAATDYEGLGTPGRHPYIVGVSEGRGTLDAVRAATQLPDAGAGRRTLLWGHSQGGHAAMFAAELAARWTPERRVLGTVAGAPPSHLPELLQSLETGDYRGYIGLAAAGLHAAYPRARLSDILTAKGLDMLSVVDRACSDEVREVFNAVPIDEVLKVEPSSVASWRSALDENEPGRVTADSPLLIIHGEADEQIPVETSAALFDELCERGQVVERRTYPGQSHAGVIIPSFLSMLQWMDDRVAGRPATTGCP